MKTLWAAIIGLAITALADPATAYVVQVTTSIPTANAADDAQLKNAFESAINDVLNDAIAFAPTVVTVQNARVIGDRIYILLLIADEDGEKTMERLSAEDSEPSDSPGSIPPPGEAAPRL